MGSDTSSTVVSKERVKGGLTALKVDSDGGKEVGVSKEDFEELAKMIGEDRDEELQAKIRKSCKRSIGKEGATKRGNCVFTIKESGSINCCAFIIDPRSDGKYDVQYMVSAGTFDVTFPKTIEISKTTHQPWYSGSSESIEVKDSAQHF